MHTYRTADKETLLTIRFNKSFYEKHRANYIPMIINVDAAETFLNRDADILTAFLQNRLSAVKRAEYEIRYQDGNVGYVFFMETDRELTEEETGMMETSVEAYQRNMAKIFNAQLFTMSEYGIVRFPADAVCRLEAA